MSGLMGKNSTSRFSDEQEFKTPYSFILYGEIFEIRVKR